MSDHRYIHEWRWRSDGGWRRCGGGVPAVEQRDICGGGRGRTTTRGTDQQALMMAQAKAWWGTAFRGCYSKKKSFFLPLPKRSGITTLEGRAHVHLASHGSQRCWSDAETRRRGSVYGSTRVAASRLPSKHPIRTARKGTDAGQRSESSLAPNEGKISEYRGIDLWPPVIKPAPL